MTSEEPGLVNRAMSRATGANIHAVATLGAYYRNACAIQDVSPNEPKEKRRRRAADIKKYAALLEHFAHTGEFPKAKFAGVAEHLSQGGKR